jgi:hypothetical protein
MIIRYFNALNTIHRESKDLAIEPLLKLKLTNDIFGFTEAYEDIDLEFKGNCNSDTYSIVSTDHDLPLQRLHKRLESYWLSKPST